MSVLQRLCLVALVGPLVATTAAMTWVAAGERAGYAPLAGFTPANAAEAAALGNAVQLARFLRQGEDVHRVHPLRPEVISSAVLRATTLEAAMWSRQVDLVEFLEREGAITAADRPGLACLAGDLEIEDVVALLAPQGTASCVPGEAMARVTARTKEMGAANE